MGYEYAGSLFGDEKPQLYRRKAGKFNDYDAFIDKFKDKKTTDDCYTPPAVMEAVLGWLKGEGLIDDATEIIRPFWPGEDYTAREYPEGCAVVDNPPFSIYAKSVRWFIARGVRFFLFGPQLTLAVKGADVCFLPVSANIIYENGAKVNTGFVTNMIEGVRLWTAPGLRAAVMAAMPPKQIIAKNTYPDELVTCATVGRIAVRGVDFRLLPSQCEEVSGLQSLAAAGKKLFGGGWLISPRAAAERAAAERAAAERAAGTCVRLSEQERAIVRRLGEREEAAITE